MSKINLGRFKGQMNSTSQQDLNFVKIRCAACNAVLFSVTPSAVSFSIRVKCRRCTHRRGEAVYVVMQISLEPVQQPDLDSTSDNTASA